ncbi:TAXI family TRAP transporter solute-binding subunit [Paracoccus sp. S3-43]|uniref:TAXI family TRAP transporter solute-binding subunit n=1 Tax=Paracoccus sp. S3-43 TaxID=3030011 RepID=UPI0023B05945|nr:TAXI family TRAP transporter solute-binding subunit [Paracoccus sp. S3-43]WEF25162.1 TAXI family TRAP transporter solute-binding subunit [Paracoccus sp. S3-43]
MAIGVENSGTFLTASLILSLTGTEPAEKLPAAPQDALPQLKAGQIDAFFYAAGAPVSLYVDGDIDGARFHLLPIQDTTLQAVYAPSTLPGGRYDFQPDPVELVTVKAVLMTYEYDSSQRLSSGELPGAATRQRMTGRGISAAAAGVWDGAPARFSSGQPETVDRAAAATGPPVLTDGRRWTLRMDEPGGAARAASSLFCESSDFSPARIRV